ETLREITKKFRIPVIVVSAHTTDGASATFKALGLGAFDFVAKPADAASARMEEIAADLIAKIKVAAGTEAPRLKPEIRFAPRPVVKAPQAKTRPSKVVAIGISTGGPNALEFLLAQLPGNFPGSIVIVQHMPEGFTDMFARRLEESCAIHVKEAQSGDM